MLRSRRHHPPSPPLHVLLVKTYGFAVCDNLSNRHVCCTDTMGCVCVCRGVQMKKKLGEEEMKVKECKAGRSPTQVNVTACALSQLL